jgi:hypothetical protein
VRWTANELARLRRLRAAGFGGETIAHRLGRTLASTKAKLHTLQLPKPARRVLTLPYVESAR